LSIRLLWVLLGRGLVGRISALLRINNLLLRVALGRIARLCVSLLLGLIRRGCNARSRTVVHGLSGRRALRNRDGTADPAHLDSVLRLHATQHSVVHAVHAILHRLRDVHTNNAEDAKSP